MHTQMYSTLLVLRRSCNCCSLPSHTAPVCGSVCGLQHSLPSCVLQLGTLI